MRVSQSGTNSVQNNNEAQAAKRAGKAQAAAAKKTDKSGAANAAAVADSVKTDISARGKEFAQAKEIASKAPDTRDEKIAELKRRIAAGKYNVDTNAVADKMVNEHLETSGLG